MAGHSLKVFTHHLAFLSSFPELQSWLNCNGFTVRYTHQDFRMQTIHTIWDNHTSEGYAAKAYEFAEHITVSYCLVCKTVEVSRRSVLFDKRNEKAAIKILDNVYSEPLGKRNDGATDASDGYPWLNEME